MNNVTTAAPQLPPGTVIDGTYTTGAVVRSRLGSVTYAATDLSGTRVDVTIYAAACFVSPVAMERSLRELRQLEKVHAPQVLRVIDAGKLAQGGIYEVHERFDSTSLAEIGSLRPAEVSRLIPEIVAALQAAQKVGVLHRNLGAEAVLRGERGIKLTGFAVGDPQGGVSFGALDCIAPEQVEGRNIDERTLVYNLAALTYRFLRGASLFTGGDSGTQLLQAAASLPPPESMPAPLFAALAKDPKSRPNLLQRFVADLDVIVRDFPQDEANSPPAARDPDPPAMSSEGGEERESSDTLAALMTDPDAPKLPSSDEKAGPTATAGVPASTPERPATTPPRPAIITGPGTLGAPPSTGVKPPPTLAPPPSLGGLPNAPSLGSLPNLGKPSVPTLGAPTLGKPAVPTLGAPVLTPPSAAPVVAAPSVGLPTIAAPSAAAAASATSAKPRTRGWTMFMEAELQGGSKPEEPAPEGDPEFYDGPVQTETGTTVAFAPTAAEPNASLARSRPAAETPDLGSQEPMTSFGARLRGEAEEAAPAAASLSPVSAPSASAEIPSFAGSNLGFVAVKQAAPVAPEAQPDALEQDVDAGGGGNTKLIVIGVVVVVAVVIAIILLTSK